MKRIFPPMTDRPGAFMPFMAFGYWIFAFVLLPLCLPLIGDGLWSDLQAASWLDISYHIINALVVVGMFRVYFRDSFLNVQIFPKAFFKTVADGLLLMLALALVLFYFQPYMAGDAYPISEMMVAVSSGVMVNQLPVFGTLCHVLFTPVAVTGLFYVAGFAPMCCRNTWLGYLTVTLLLMLPAGFDILWRGNTEGVLIIYLLQLPMHWIACWTYQKMDSVWAPMATLAAFNLVTSLLGIFIV